MTAVRKRNKAVDIILKLLLLHLFPVFFILHGYNENFGLIPFDVLVHLFINYSAILFLLFAISLFALRNRDKAFVFSFFLLCIFFFFGFFHDQLKRIFPASFFSSYTFILPFILVVIISIFFFTRDRVRDVSLVSKFVNVLLCAFVFIELTVFGYNLVTNKASKNNLSLKDGPANNRRPGCVKKNPDIFFIVFDEYMSSPGLARYFNFTNSTIDSLLRSTGFYASEDSKSNYNMTPFSLASTFNYNYLSIKQSDSFISHNSFLKAIETFRENKLTSFLASQGYDIINYGCFEVDDASLRVAPYFERLPADMINNQTIIFRIKRDIGWYFATRNIFNGQFRIPISYKKSKEYHLYRNNFNVENTITELTRTSDRPKFVYAHFMMPHDPYFLDSAGNFVSDTAILQGTLNRERAYLSQLKYCNKSLGRIIQTAAIKTGRERVVIIEGDHGFGLHNNAEFKDREFPNLNAYYFSDRDYSSLYRNISPVNSFRVILNKYFCYNLPLLKDSSFYIRQSAFK
jgi:hypothetical protein